MSKITVEESATEIVIRIQKEVAPTFDGKKIVKDIILDALDSDMTFRASVRG